MKAGIGDRVIILSGYYLGQEGEVIRIYENGEIVVNLVDMSVYSLVVSEGNYKVIVSKNLDHTANLALRVAELERTVKRLSDMLIKHDVDIHRLKNETEYLDETWRSTREVQLNLIRAITDELEAIKCEK